MKDYEKSYNEFWKEIIEDKDGNINKDQLMRELHDYQHIIGEVEKVYDNITGGRISKIMTNSDVVISVADENYREIYEEYNKDEEE